MLYRCIGSGSDGNCHILISDDGEILILDAGMPYKEVLKAIDYRISDVVGVFVSHVHADHSKYVKDFRNNGIEIFEPYKGGHQNIILGGFVLFAFDLPHDGCENRGLLINHIASRTYYLYMTDLEYCQFTFKKFNVSAMIVEANYKSEYIENIDEHTSHSIKGHCEIETTLGIIKANQTDMLRNVILCHLSKHYSDEQEFIGLAQEITAASVCAAQKGLEVKL